MYILSAGNGSCSAAFKSDVDVVPFYDGIVLPDAFDKTPKVHKAEDKLRAQIKRMLAKLDKQVTLPQPAAGDCFFCQMQMNDSRGNIRDPHDCIREHLKENYLHGSLLVRAVMAQSYTAWAVRTDGFNRGDKWARQDMKRNLKKFLCSAVGV